MRKAKKALLVFYNGRSNAGGAERMVLYLDEYLQSRGVKTEIIDETFLLNTFLGRQFKRIFNYRHFRKRKPVYMARFTSAYLWTRKTSRNIVISNGEPTPFYPVDFVINQGCYHVMEKAYGRESDQLSRVANLQRKACLLCKQVITVTETVKKDLINYYKVPAEKISLVSNRVDSNFFKPLPRALSQRKTVLYAGRLENGKGLNVLQKLAAIIEKNDHWHFLIACNNSSNTDLFAGHRNTTIKVGLDLHNINEEAYSKADLVIFPSLFESFGMVTLEALSAGVPVIGTPVGIIPELHARNYPGVHVLEPFEGDEILIHFASIIQSFEATVNRHELHEMIRHEFGIETYRQRLDEVIGPRIL